MRDDHQKEVKFRFWSYEDRTAILELMELVFGKGRLTSEEFFDWQYKKNPAGRAVIVCCQSSDGTLAAVYSVIPLPLVIDGGRTQGSLSLNTATHPAFQRRGLFVKAAEMVYAHLAEIGIGLTIGFPNHLSYPGFIKRLGFADVGRARTFRHVLDLRKFLGPRFETKALWPLFLAGNLILRASQRPIKSHMPVSHLTTFEGLSVESLWENEKVSVAVDSEWLNWRYVDHPFIRYDIALAGTLEQPLGLVVYKVDESRAGNRGVVMELLLSPDANEAVVEALLAHALGSFEAMNCVAVSAYASPGSRKGFLLRKAGFWATPGRLETAGSMILRRHLPHVPPLTLTDIDFSPGMMDTA